MSIDLHIHSLFSDGTHSPHEIVQLAKKQGITAISITDHDTLSGIGEAIDSAKEYDIEVVPGIELSVCHNECSMHILGYFVDHNSPELKKKITKLQSARKERNRKILAKLNTLGMRITMEEVEKVSQIGQIGRPHIAKVLHNKGYVTSIRDAFDRYLAKGAPAYQSRFVYSAEEAIAMIKNAGGLSVLAHPLQFDPTLTKIVKIIDELVALGLDGLEVYYPTHSKKIRKKLKDATQKQELIFTGGSDYHGSIRPGTALAGGLNMHVPAELLDKMKERWIMS